MTNVTFGIDDAMLREVKVIAAKRNTSVNALVRSYFAHLIESGVQDSESMNGNLQTLFDYSVGRIGRHRAKSFLGVDDPTLTAMLRQAGFPPPRASQEEEDRMLDEIKDIHLSS
ncbi:hypothetical protein FN976_24365 [Caenimonas sedimenti]|uniref:Uncharacterized protein n=1 Tax=Caenimonas sedimenti TaxID=2596921 RepID=A0A562ZIQ1_9BURK|nr:hypothetical protein [Caenimonas sedimenti]TWO68074.1 hypothetical protein FN976_24365 [Caenimonas sedimenti]